MIKKRDIVVAILLTFITCGIYSLYWQYKIYDESRYVSGDTEGSAGMDLLLTIITCGIYGFVAVYKAGKRMYATERMQGNAYATDDTLLIVVLYIFIAIGAMAILQSKLNRFAS